MSYSFRAKDESDELITGYMIGGVTPILTMWNGKGVTKEDIQALYNEYKSDLEEEGNARDYHERTYQDMIKDGSIDSSVTMEDYVSRNLDEWKMEMSGVESVLEELQSVIDFIDEYGEELHRGDDDWLWELFSDLIGRAHHTMDEHIRKIQYGEYHYVD